MFFEMFINKWISTELHNFSVWILKQQQHLTKNSFLKCGEASNKTEELSIRWRFIPFSSKNINLCFSNETKIR